MLTRPPHSFGKLLRTYRIAAGLTQEELAARASMSSRGISDLERGARRTPYKETIELQATALHLAHDERAAFATAARQSRRSAAPSVDAQTSSQDALSAVVGRKDELALLQQLLEGNRPPVVLLAGEAGMGKTRLLREATTRARTSGWAILQGGCSRLGGQLLYSPLLEALEDRMCSQPSVRGL